MASKRVIYRVVTAKTATELEAQLNKLADEGYRIESLSAIPSTLNSAETLFAVLGKEPALGPVQI